MDGSGPGLGLSITFCRIRGVYGPPKQPFGHYLVDHAYGTYGTVHATTESVLESERRNVMFDQTA